MHYVLLSVWCFNTNHLVCVQTSSIWMHIDVLDCWEPKMLQGTWNVWYAHVGPLIHLQTNWIWKPLEVSAIFCTTKSMALFNFNMYPTPPLNLWCMWPIFTLPNMIWTYWRDPSVLIGPGSLTNPVATSVYNQFKREVQQLIAFTKIYTTMLQYSRRLIVKLVPKLAIHRSRLYWDCWSTASSNLHVDHNWPIHVAPINIFKTMSTQCFKHDKTRSNNNQGRSQGDSAPPDISKKTMPKRLHNFLFSFVTILSILGRVIHHWKGVFKTFPTVYYKPPNFKNFNW
jgi:hypothetical protein